MSKRFDGVNNNMPIMTHSARFALHAMITLIFLAPSMTHAQWSGPQDGVLIIRGGWLFDGVSDTRRPNSGIIIRNGEIAEVDADLQQPILTTADVMELQDSETILPGMIDLHAHYNLDLVDKGRVEEVVNNGIIFLANGVTSTWSAGEYYPERVIAQRDRIDVGEAIGPRLFASGPYFGAFRCETRSRQRQTIALRGQTTSPNRRFVRRSTNGPSKASLASRSSRRRRVRPRY